MPGISLYILSRLFLVDIVTSTGLAALLDNRPRGFGPAVLHLVIAKLDPNTACYNHLPDPLVTKSYERYVTCTVGPAPESSCVAGRHGVDTTAQGALPRPPAEGLFATMLERVPWTKAWLYDIS